MYQHIFCLFVVFSFTFIDVTLAKIYCQIPQNVLYLETIFRRFNWYS